MIGVAFLGGAKRNGEHNHRLEGLRVVGQVALTRGLRTIGTDRNTVRTPVSARVCRACRPTR